MSAGAWRYQNMTGYTSVGAGSSVLPVRLNCPPEILFIASGARDWSEKAISSAGLGAGRCSVASKRDKAAPAAVMPAQNAA